MWSGVDTRLLLVSISICVPCALLSAHTFDWFVSTGTLALATITLTVASNIVLRWRHASKRAVLCDSLVMSAGLSLVTSVLSELVAPDEAWSAEFLIAVQLVAMCAVSFIVGGLIGISWLTARGRLKSQVVGSCPHCGYNLLGLPTLTCPECGYTAGGQGMNAPPS